MTNGCKFAIISLIFVLVTLECGSCQMAVGGSYKYNALCFWWDLIFNFELLTLRRHHFAL